MEKCAHDGVKTVRVLLVYRCRAVQRAGGKYMRSFLKKTKHITCLVLLAAMVFTAVQLFPAKAASGAITVTGLLHDNAVL